MVKLHLKIATQFIALLVTIMFVITWTAWPALAQSASASDEAQESETSASDGEDEPADSGSSESTNGGDSRAALIMDASDSMMAQDVDGGTRLDAAKQAANQLVDSLPETAVMGMLVYGASESNAPDNRERGCQDIDVLAPVERIDKEELKGEIDALEAQGYTPMGNALRAAADELGSEGERSIILVSDGIDTCAPPPVCEVAEELAGDGLDLAIHTVGFKADEAAQAELECISEISGGIYVEAENAEELGNQLEFLVQRDAVGYEMAGTEFEYADNIDDAKWLDEGQYQTHVTVSGTESEVNYFRVAVPEGHNAMISVTGIPQRDATGSVASGSDGSVRVNAAEVSNHMDGSDCRADESMTVWRGNVDMRNLFPTEPMTSFIDGEEVGNCDMEEWIVGHTFTAGTDGELVGEELGVEVNIYYEPVPPENVIQLEGDFGSLAQESPDVKFGEAQGVENGTSFNDAPEIEPGTYKNSIVAGETHYYKIPVEWGQVPEMAIRNRLNENIDSAWLSLQLVNPVKSVVEDTYNSQHTSNDTDVSHLMSDRPLRYNNRNANAGGDRTSIAGDHFIAVSLSVPWDEESLRNIDQEYELAVDVTRPVDEGSDWRPTYEPGPESSDTPPTFEAASSEAEETATESEEATDTDTSNAAAEGESGGGGFNGAIWGAVGILVLGLLAAIAVIVMRMRNKQ
ncbi:MAG: vWA domain-containing protein [Corynebacterium casei]